MKDDRSDELDPRQLARLVGQADKLVSSGRLTPEEAERLRSADDQRSAMQVVRDIRSRHASERLGAAVAEGSVGREEADAILGRIHAGEHSRELHSGPGWFRSRRRKHADPTDDPSAAGDEEE